MVAGNPGFYVRIAFRAGTEMLHVDYLSKNPVFSINSVINLTEYEWVKAAQSQRT